MQQTKLEIQKVKAEIEKQKRTSVASGNWSVDCNSLARPAQVFGKQVGRRGKKFKGKLW